jgi:hypothetical protein
MSRAVIAALAAVAVSGSAVACAASDDRADTPPSAAGASPWAARHELPSRVQTRSASPQSYGCVAFGRRSTVVWLNQGGSTPAGQLAQPAGC